MSIRKSLFRLWPILSFGSFVIDAVSFWMVQHKPAVVPGTSGLNYITIFLVSAPAPIGLAILLTVLGLLLALLHRVWNAFRPVRPRPAPTENAYHPHQFKTPQLVTNKAGEATGRAAAVIRLTALLLSALILAMLLAVPAPAAELRLTIKGVHSDMGELLIGLYDNPVGFANAIANAANRGLMADSGRLVGVSMRAKNGTQGTVFTQLPPGQYAVIVIHDENDNGRLDKDAMGVPTEGYGFSNDAQGFLSAPSFDAAAVTIGDAGKSIAISLMYPRTASLGW